MVCGERVYFKNEKAIVILSLNKSECGKLLRSVSSRIGYASVI